jgi:hypothetical protein
MGIYQMQKHAFVIEDYIIIYKQYIQIKREREEERDKKRGKKRRKQREDDGAQIRKEAFLIYVEEWRTLAVA